LLNQLTKPLTVVLINIDDQELLVSINTWTSSNNACSIQTAELFKENSDCLKVCYAIDGMAEFHRFVVVPEHFREVSVCWMATHITPNAAYLPSIS